MGEFLIAVPRAAAVASARVSPLDILACGILGIGMILGLWLVLEWIKKGCP